MLLLLQLLLMLMLQRRWNSVLKMKLVQQLGRNGATRTREMCRDGLRVLQRCWRWWSMHEQACIKMVLLLLQKLLLLLLLVMKMELLAHLRG